MAAETIKIDYGAYKKAVKVISNAQKRSSNNNGNFKSKISKTDLPSIGSYMETLETLRTHLEKYNTLVANDTGKLLKIGEHLRKAGSGE